MSTGSSTNSSTGSNTGSAVKGNGGFASARNAADRTTPVRWIVLFTGRTATDDYQPSATDNEKPDLVKEVTDICVAFHPHSDIRLFPQSGEALLYYRAKSTGEWIVTRVATAPNPDGVRTALEYCSVVLSGDDFQRLLGGNPFAATGEGGLLDRVRAHFLSGARTPIGTMPVTAPKGRAGTADTEEASLAELVGLAPSKPRNKPGDAPLHPELEADGVSTPENVRILQDFCAAHAATGSTTPLPTFTTWWSSGGSVPVGCFEIVLRARATRAISLRDAADATTHLAAEIKTALPRTPTEDAIAGELARSILANADAAQQAVSHAAAHLNTETPVQFQAQLTEAARLTGQITADIAALTERLGTALAATDATRLADLSQRSEELSRDLPRVRHPNPFARRNAAPETSATGITNTTTGAVITSAAPTATTSITATQPKGPNVMAIAGVAVGILIAGLGVWGALGHSGSHNTAATPAPPAKTKPSGGAANTVKVKPPTNPVAAALNADEATAEATAKAEALKSVPAAVKTAKGGVVADAEIEKIVGDSITTAYKASLTRAQYHTVYGSGKPWTYAHYKTVVPAIALSVHEATVVAITQAVAAKTLQRVEAAKVPTPPASKTRTTDDTTPTPPKKHPRKPDNTSNGDSGDTPKPKRHPASDNTPATPKAGSAAQTGL